MSASSQTTLRRLTPMEKAKTKKKNAQQNPTDVEQIFNSTDNASVSAIHQKLDNINERMITLESSVASLLEAVQKLAKQTETAVEFPLESLTDVDDIEKKIEEDPQRYIALLRSILMPEGIIKNFSRVLSVTLILDFNYNGTFSKNGLIYYQTLNKALYQAVKRDGYTFGDFEKDIRTAFSKEKNKIYKSNSFIRKKNSQIEQVFVEEDQSELTESIIPDEVIKKRKINL